MRAAHARHAIRHWALAALLIHCVIATAAYAQRTTPHFQIFHEQGFSPVTEAYARLVEQGLESAYDTFVSQGFTIFAGRIRVDILGAYPDELGAEYLEQDENGRWVPYIEIANETIMTDYLSYAYVDTALADLVASTCAHELFHVIQDYHSLHATGDISEWAFIEAHATAIQEAIVPEANDYLEPALDFLCAPDSMAFFQRTYDAGIFWVYALDQLGLGFILDVMKASALYDGRYAVDHALANTGETFFDIWTDFAASLATGKLPDAEIMAALVPEAEGPGWWRRDRDFAIIPPPVVRATWTGTALDLDRVNATNESEYIPYFEDDGIGAQLRVAHAYGIDILEIEIASLVPAVIDFRGDALTQFRTLIASETDAEWTHTALNQSLVIQPTDTMARLRIIVTRSEAGTGSYSVTLRPAAP